MSLFKTVKKHVIVHWQLYILCIVAVILFLIPNLFWGNLYVVGGDDARLYYLFPLEYLKNFSFNVMTGNSLGSNSGYLPVSYSAPTIGVILILKTLLPFLNTQLVMYGLIFASGFVFFHLLLQEWITKKTPFTFWGSVVASLFYILSPYITRTFFQHQFISIFLLMVVPGCLYFFVSGLKRQSMVRIVACALLYSIFSSTVFSFPWLLPVLLTLIPFFIFLIARYGWFFWKAFFVCLSVILLCNVYWIIHYIIPVIYNIGETNFTASLLSTTFKQQNHDLIAALVHLNDPVNQMVNYLRTSWSQRQGTTVIQSVGMVYLFIILSAGLVLHGVKKDTRILYLVSSVGLLLAMVFVTPNFGLWNLQLFEFFNDRVPFFGIFRNMYDKFALAMAFHYAFVLCISFVVLGEAKIKSVCRCLCLASIFVITVVNAISYIHPIYNDTEYSTRISGQLNDDYIQLTDYIKQLHTSSRFVWLPMTFPGYVYIGDGIHPNHFYTGISPLQIFSRSSDLAGFYGLQTARDPALNWTVLNFLKDKNYPEVGKIFQRLNVEYVIVNHDLLPPVGSKTLEQFDFVKYQNEEYKKTILGEKVHDFGKRYSLYTINGAFRGNTVFLEDSGTSLSVPNTSLTFHKDSNGQYDVILTGLDKPVSLVLLEPYNALWKIRLLNGTKSYPYPTKHTLAYGYGNKWKISPTVDQSDGSYSLHLQIYFWPNKLIVPSIIISVLTFVLAALYIVTTVVIKKLKTRTQI